MCQCQKDKPCFNFNPRPPRGGRRAAPVRLTQTFRGISIHALREEGDRRGFTPRAADRYFNPRPPRGGRRCQRGRISAPIFISIHALREEGDNGGVPGSERCNISIHALREEGDPTSSASAATTLYFNPRPPRGGRRFVTVGMEQGVKISIHALREEGDSKSGEKIRHVCSIIHTCAQFEKELYEGSGEMQNKSC